CVAAMLTVTAPWIIRNRVVLGEFALATPNMGQNFAMGNQAEATGTYLALRRGHANGEDEQREWTRAAEQAEGRRLTAREVSDHYLHLGLSWIRENPAAWVRLTIRKWLMVWNSYEICDTEDYYLYVERAALLHGLDAIYHFGVLCPLAAAGLVLAQPRWRGLWFLYAWLIVSAGATAVFVVFARYRAVLLPVLCIFAAAAIASGLDLIRRRRLFNRRGDAAALTACVIAAILCNWTVFMPRRTQPISYSNHATAL